MESYMKAYAIAYIFVAIIVATILGFVSKHINESKGYDGGFAWGFWLGVIGIIVVAVRPENRSREYMYTAPQYNNSPLSNWAHEVDRKKILESGGWECRECHRLNAAYVTTCLCGVTLHENNKPNENAADTDEIIKMKELLDAGIITEEEFEKKKKDILGI